MIMKKLNMSKAFETYSNVETNTMYLEDIEIKEYLNRDNREKFVIIKIKDYDENAPRFERPSVRGIISREGKIALVHSLKYDYYKFPGGGCKKNEKHALQHIFMAENLVGKEKSSTFAPCFSWY